MGTELGAPDTPPLCSVNAMSTPGCPFCAVALWVALFAVYPPLLLGDNSQSVFWPPPEWVTTVQCRPVLLLRAVALWAARSALSRCGCSFGAVALDLLVRRCRAVAL